MRAISKAFLLVALTFGFAGADLVGLRTFLIDPGVTASGMGCAYTAVADDPSALYWNPAGLTLGEPGMEGLLAHTEWFLDVRQEYAVFTWNRGIDAFAVGISGWYVGGIERRGPEPESEPLGHFGYYDIIVSLAYARELGPVRAGVTAKPFYSKIDMESAHGIAADFGLLYETPLNGLTLGGAVSNLGNKPYYIEEEFSLPVDMRGGASFRIGMGDHPATLLISAEVRKSKDDDARTHTGVELGLNDFGAVRFGYKWGYDDEDFSFGFGIRRNGYSVQYAVIPFSSDLGTVSRFAFGVYR